MARSTGVRSRPVSAQIRQNHHFYTQTMGMRLVKRSVNQDDVSAYHLFYADAKASPGTDITFFDWPVDRERRGTHSIAQTALSARLTAPAARASKPAGQSSVPSASSAVRVVAARRSDASSIC